MYKNDSECQKGRENGLEFCESLSCVQLSSVFSLIALVVDVEFAY